MNPDFDIAVIGGGFSGLMVIANLIQQGGAPKIFWNGQPDTSGRGTAYGTAEYCHLLNVRANHMSAWADRPDDFWNWLDRRHPGRFSPDDYVPRMIFGQYLDDIRTDALKSGNVTENTDAIPAISRAGDCWQLQMEDKTVTCRSLILAVGNPPIADLGWPKNGIYINDFWSWRLANPSAVITKGLGENDTVLIAGTGLTMADAALSCLRENFRGRIVAISPRGQMPAPHRDPVLPYARAAALETEMKSRAAALHYFRTVRAHISALPNHEWRIVINALRPHVPALWEALPEPEKKRSMRHAWSWWNTQRHRMATTIADALRAVEIVAGRLVETKEDGTVGYRPRGSDKIQTLRAGRVINCTGPDYRRMIGGNSPLASLMSQGFVKSGPLGLGIAMPNAPGLYAIGTILLGEKLETTAVPELRVQAAEIARRIVND